MKPFLRRMALALPAVLLALPLSALDPNKALTQESHRIWGQEEGLFQPTVYSIVQSRKGFLWLGTQDSLIRFDGLHFREYDHAAGAGIQRALIRNLLEDDEGNLWVGSIGSGLVRIAPDGSFKSFKASDGFDSQNAFCLSKGEDGSIFICTDKGLVRYKRDKFQMSTVVQGLPSNNIRDMCQTADGTLWISGIDFGLMKSDGLIFKPVVLDGLSRSENINTLACAADNVVWIGKSTGLIRLQGMHTEAYTTHQGLPDNAISSLHVSPDQSLWIGTNDGVTRLRNGQFSIYRVRDGLSHSLVLSLYTDREGTLWVGTKNGLDQFTEDKVTSYTTNEGMLSNNAGAVAEDSAGRLWVGTMGQGLNVFDGHKFNAITHRDGLLDDTILSLLPEAGGDIWVGTERGINRLHNRQVVSSYTSAQGLPGNRISSLFRDQQGTLWAGTNKGLAFLAGDSFQVSNLGLLADHRSIYALSASHSVRLFASAEGPSISFLKDNQPQFRDLQTVQPVSCFYFDQSIHVGWLGTLGSGLLHWQNGVFTRVRVKDGLYDNRIYAILRDGNANLWLASSKGIFRVSEQELQSFVDGKTRYVTSIPFSTGQLRFECRSGVQPAAIRSHDGRLWFATTNGVVVVDPNHLKSNTQPPPVEITSVIINGQRTEPAQSIALTPFERNLEIRYAGLSFIAPDKMTFRYMLEGYDKGWIDAGNRREAFYGKLPPGQFRFLVTARNADGVSSANSAELSLQIAPFFYERKWFGPAVFILLASLVVVWYRLRIRRLKQRFDLVLAERSRIARELHDTLLQGLSGVTMQLQALWIRLGPSREKQLLNEIIQDAAKCSAEARQSLLGLRSPGASPVRFTHNLANCCHEANVGDRLDLQLDLDSVTLLAMPDAEFQLLRIAREAVANSVQHADATQMHVTLRVTQSELNLSLSDNGKGFYPETSHYGHFGLLGMRERAAEIGAQLRVTSSPGFGTLVTVRLPLTAAGKTGRLTQPEHQIH